MTKDQATHLWQSLLESYGMTGSEGLNSEGVGGISVLGGEVYAEFTPESSALDCSAFICPWPGKFDADAFRKLHGLAAPEGEFDTAGGELNYQPENNGLFLTRRYRTAPPAIQFANEIDALMQASVKWDEDVVDLVLAPQPKPERERS
jgi:hypothetical protein